MVNQLSSTRKFGVFFFALTSIILIAILMGSGVKTASAGTGDEDPPDCFSFIPRNGEAQIKIVFRDSWSGMSSIDLINSKNISSVQIPSFSPGYVNNLTSTAYVSDPAFYARVAFMGTDVAGNTKYCTGNYNSPQPYANP